MTITTNNRSVYEQYVEELNLDFRNGDCLSNKIKICSYLVCCGASAKLEGYPVDNKDFRTGNSGLQALVGNPALRALIPSLYMEETNPIEIKGIYHKNKAVVNYNGTELFEIDILPDIYTGNSAVNVEFDTLIAAIPNKPYGIRSCAYHQMGKPCAFCILTAKKVAFGPNDLVTAFDRVKNSTGLEPQVLLTGGTSQEEDRGLSKYIPYVYQLLCSFPQARICIEASPPANTSHLEVLRDAGIDTFAANIEFYSYQNRKEFLPGKSEIALDQYTNALNYCSEMNIKTFSALIVGPEKESDCLAGVEFLSRNNIPTNFICLRPFPGAAMQTYSRVNPSSFLDLTVKANKIMEQYGVLNDLANTAGCGSCGGCSMEMNLFRLYNYNDQETTIN